MPTITRFEEIEAWQTARELTKMIYSITDEGKISRDVGYLSEQQFSSLFQVSEKVSRQLSRFIAYLEKNSSAYRVKEDSVEYEI